MASAEGRERVSLCGTMELHARLQEYYPEARAGRAALREQIGESIASGEASRVAGELVTIQTVVHVVYRTDDENISDEQIMSQVDVLNRDFRASNPNQSNVPDVWQDLVADANVEFELASEDPDGSSTNGITRTQTDREAFTTDNWVKFSEGGGIAPWPTDQYLNIWVCNLVGLWGDTLLGYAQFPGDAPETDGVVILYTAFGTTGTAQAPFDGGQTATHEVGHFLDLRHIWGDTDDCSGTDHVSDTPTAQVANTGCPEFPHVSCDNGPNGDMFMNYMDYTHDACMYMFTRGQVERMNAALATARATLAGLG